MKVELINHTPYPFEALVFAARNCYKSFEKGGREADERLIRSIVRRGHHSILEFVDFTFYVDGISRTCSHQLVRHRIGSYAQQSQRYVGEESFDFTVPPEIERDEELLKVFKDAMESARAAYGTLLRAGIRKEDARFVLPQACHTSIVVKYNLRSLRHFFDLRMSERAQWEIREVACRMFDLAYDVIPIALEDMKPLRDELSME
ncbi:MAG: FAD-dependent thymidylate synthase [bacterium]